jgi:hypothetical protein
VDLDLDLEFPLSKERIDLFPFTFLMIWLMYTTTTVL